MRLASLAPGVRVSVLAQDTRVPNRDECRKLGQGAHQLALVREVILHAHGMPVVFAHSVTGRRDIRGAWRNLRSLGNRPLAEALFADPRVRREAPEFMRIDARHPLWRPARRVIARDMPALWARRSRFVRRGRPLLVTEVFLPALLELAQSSPEAA